MSWNSSTSVTSSPEIRYGPADGLNQLLVAKDTWMCCSSWYHTWVPLSITLKMLRSDWELGGLVLSLNSMVPLTRIRSTWYPSAARWQVKDLAYQRSSRSRSFSAKSRPPDSWL